VLGTSVGVCGEEVRSELVQLAKNTFNRYTDTSYNYAKSVKSIFPFCRKEC